MTAEKEPPTGPVTQEPRDSYRRALGSALMACPVCGAAVGTDHIDTHDAWHREQA